ncbi:hypothetical protein ACS0TY_006097 [Phlomoides rotata]
MGFSVRKATIIFSRDGNNVLLSKEYVCSCNDKRMRKNGILPETTKVKKKIRITRTNCKTQMRARLTKNWKNENHLHRPERATREGKTVVIMEMTSSGIRPADSYKYLAHSARGEEQDTR